MTKKKNQPPPVQGSLAFWLMCPWGIIMPSAVPDGTDVPPGTIQVRARDAAHLDRFRDIYCPGLGKTMATPGLDYDFRAYVLRDDLAWAMFYMTQDIDAPRFKPLTHGPLGLKDKVLADRLHGVYNACWGQMLKLSPAKQAAWQSRYTNIAQPDPHASSKVCRSEGHIFGVGSKGAPCARSTAENQAVMPSRTPAPVRLPTSAAAR